MGWFSARNELQWGGFAPHRTNGWAVQTRFIFGVYDAQDPMLALLLNPLAKLLAYHCMTEFADNRGENAT